MLETTAQFIGIIYIITGTIGFLFNIITLLMIAVNRAFRLSAYTMMANLALADAIMMVIAGIVCGFRIVSSKNHWLLNVESISQMERSNSSEIDRNFLPPKTYQKQFLQGDDQSQFNDFSKDWNDAISQNISEIIEVFAVKILSFALIIAWTASICSYAFLGLNRCIAICFYRTRAKTFNRISTALICSGITWAIGIFTGLLNNLSLSHY